MIGLTADIYIVGTDKIQGGIGLTGGISRDILVAIAVAVSMGSSSEGLFVWATCGFQQTRRVVCN